MQTKNGTPAGELPVIGRWVKSAFSVQGNCVEMAELEGGDVAMRNSNDPDGSALVFSRAEITAFVRGARVGNFVQFCEQ